MWHELDATLGLYEFCRGIMVDPSCSKVFGLDVRHIAAHELAHRDLTLGTTYGLLCYMVDSVLGEPIRDGSERPLRTLLAALVDNCRDVQELFATAVQLMVIREYHGRREEDFFFKHLPVHYMNWLQPVFPLVNGRWDSEVKIRRLWAICSASMNTDIVERRPPLLLDEHERERYLSRPENNPNKRLDALVRSFRSEDDWINLPCDTIIQVHRSRFDAAWFFSELADCLTGEARRAITSALRKVEEDPWIRSLGELSHDDQVGLSLRYRRLDLRQALRPVTEERLLEEIRWTDVVSVCKHDTGIQDQYLVFCFRMGGQGHVICTSVSGSERVRELLGYATSSCAFATEHWTLHSTYPCFASTTRPVFVTITSPYHMTGDVWAHLFKNSAGRLLGIYEDNSREAVLYARRDLDPWVYCLPIDRGGLCGAMRHLREVFGALPAKITDFWRSTAEVEQANKYQEFIKEGYWGFELVSELPPGAGSCQGH